MFHIPWISLVYLWLSILLFHNAQGCHTGSCVTAYFFVKPHTHIVLIWYLCLGGAPPHGCYLCYSPCCIHLFIFSSIHLGNYYCPLILVMCFCSLVIPGTNQVNFVLSYSTYGLRVGISTSTPTTPIIGSFFSVICFFFWLGYFWWNYCDWYCCM